MPPENQTSESEQKKDKTDLPAIRTYKTDAEIFATKSKTSFVSAAAAEIERNNKASFEKRPPGFFNKIIFAGIFFVLIAASAGGIYYFFFRPEANLTAKDPEMPQSLISVDEKKVVMLDDDQRDTLLEKFKAALNEPFEQGKIRAIYFQIAREGGKVYLPPADFVNISEISPPDKFMDYVRSYTLGALSKDEKNFPFIIFKVSDPEGAFREMLNWERLIVNGFRGVFENLPVFGESNETFEDIIIKNQDARMLKNEGNPVLIYSFFNKNLLIITTSDRALAEIITRYEIFPPN